MDDDFDSILSRRPQKDFDIRQYLKDRARQRQEEYEKLTYSEREEKKRVQREVKKKSLEDFLKIKVSEEIADIWAKVYDYIDNHGCMYPSESQRYIDKANNAFDDNDINALYDIYDEIQKPRKERNLVFYKDEILKSIGCHKEELEDIFKAIKHDYEADIVLACVQGSDWITKLPRQYPFKPIYSEYTYKDQVRLHRRMLEEELQDVGVIARRAQKISQILLSI